MKRLSEDEVDDFVNDPSDEPGPAAVVLRRGRDLAERLYRAIGRPDVTNAPTRTAVMGGSPALLFAAGLYGWYGLGALLNAEHIAFSLIIALTCGSIAMFLSLFGLLAGHDLRRKPLLFMTGILTVAAPLAGAAFYGLTSVQRPLVQYEQSLETVTKTLHDHPETTSLAALLQQGALPGSFCPGTLTADSGDAASEGVACTNYTGEKIGLHLPSRSGKPLGPDRDELRADLTVDATDQRLLQLRPLERDEAAVLERHYDMELSSFNDDTLTAYFALD